MVDRQPNGDTQVLDAVFGALADPTRRALIGLLRDAGELRVSDLAAAFDMSLNGVSKHIKVLERAGVVRRRVEGRTHWLSVDWPSMQSAYEWLHHHHHFWSERLDALVDYVAARGPQENEAGAVPADKGEQQDE